MQVKVIKLEDGLDYFVLDEIEKDNVTYVYLANVLDETDFCIRKVNMNVNEYLLVGLDNEKEFDRALEIFTDKNKRA